MLPTTPEFTTAIDSNIRQIVARARINFSDVLLDLTAAPQLETDTLATEGLAVLLAEDGRSLQTEFNVQANTFPDQLVNGRRDATRKWASADGDSFPDGSFFPAPGDAEEASFNEIGWWGSYISGASGVFTPSQKVSITFSARSLNRFDIVADGRRGEYPVDFDVYFFTDADVLISTVEVRGNTLVDRSEVVTLDNVARIQLEIFVWSAEGKNAKITEISPIFEQIFESQDIVSFSIVEQRETGSSSNIPTGGITSNEADIVLINQNRIFDNNNSLSPFFGNVRQNARIFLEVGVQTAPGVFEYVPVFNGWSGGWNVPDSEIEASTAARDRLELLTRSVFETSAVIENDTFYAWFERVFNNAGLSIADYSIDLLLDTADYIVPFGWIERQSHRSALELLAAGSGANVYVDRNGIIQVESIEFLARTNRVPVKTYTRSDYSNKDNQPIYANLANEVIVRTSPRVASVSKTVYETIASEPESINPGQTQTYTIFYTEQPIINAVATISPPVAGLSISDTDYYSWGADIQVTSTSAVIETFQFSVTGNSLDITGQQSIVFRNQDSINRNGIYSLEYEATQFLQRRGIAETIADILVRSFSDPQRDLTVTFEPGGDPSIELNDMISITDRYETRSYNIVNTQITYNGGLNIQHEGRIIGFTVTPLAAETGAILLTEAGAQILAEGVIQT